MILPPHGILTPASTLFAAAGQAVDPPSIRRAWLYFGTIAVLLILFVFVLALLGVVRRRRVRALERKPSKDVSADPWAEAGRRVRPFPDRRDEES